MKRLMIVGPHYWLPQLFSFLLAIQVIAVYGEEFYSIFSLSMFYIGAFGAFFSFKSFSVLMSRRGASMAPSGMARMFGGELLVRIFGVIFAVVVCYFVSVGFQQLLPFLVAFSVVSIVRSVDPFFEYIFISSGKLVEYGGLRAAGSALAFAVNMAVLHFFSPDIFLVVYVLVAFSDVAAKLVFLFRSFPRKSSIFGLVEDGPKVGRGSGEGVWVFLTQNIFGVFNKQFDVLVLALFVRDVGAFAAYMFVRQIHNAVMTTAQPVTHLLLGGKQVKGSKSIIAIIIVGGFSLAVLGCEVLGFFLGIKGFIDVARQFYPIWALFFLAVPLPALFIEFGIFRYQMILSCICSMVAVAFWSSSGFSTTVEVLIDVRLVVVLTATIGQFFIYYQFAGASCPGRGNHRRDG